MVVITNGGTIGSGVVYGRDMLLEVVMEDVRCIAWDGTGDVQAGGSGVMLQLQVSSKL